MSTRHANTWRERPRWRVLQFAWLGISCWGSAGCHLADHERSAVYANGLRTIIHEPAQFGWHKDDYRSRRRWRQAAHRAWADVVARCPQLADDADHGEGFRDGYADYLYAGGTGEPPLLPPRRYWKVGYQTPAGTRAIQAYFAGFRQGAADAMASGLRTVAVVPSSLYVDAPQFLPVETIVDDTLPPTPDTVEIQTPQGSTPFVR